MRVKQLSPIPLTLALSREGRGEPSAHAHTPHAGSGSGARRLRPEDAARSGGVAQAGLAQSAGARDLGFPHRPRRKRRGGMARHVPRPDAQPAGGGGARVQRRSAGGRGARRAGRRLCEGCGGRVVSRRGSAGARWRQDGRGQQRAPGRSAKRLLGAGRMGPRALRARRRRRAVRLGARRSRVRPAIAGRADGEELVPGDRSEDAAPGGAGQRALGRAAGEPCQGPRARRARRCHGRGQRRGQPRNLSRYAASARPFLSAVGACARASAGPLPRRSGRGARRAAGDAAADSRRLALRAAGAAARRHRRRAARGGGLQSHRRSAGRAPSAHLAHRQRELRSRANCSCCSSRTTRS